MKKITTVLLLLALFAPVAARAAAPDGGETFFQRVARFLGLTSGSPSAPVARQSSIPVDKVAGATVDPGNSTAVPCSCASGSGSEGPGGAEYGVVYMDANGSCYKYVQQKGPREY